jgi:peptidoglycan-associated lipoprotein
VSSHDPLNRREPHAGAREVRFPVEALERREQPLSVLHVEAGPVVPYEEDPSVRALLLADLDARLRLLAPALRGDPWGRLGVGYRLYWERDATGPMGAMGATVLRHGLEILTAKVGYDVRVSKDVALGPVIGADLNVFAWQDTRAFSSMQVGTFVYAGLQGRLDVGGARSMAVASAQPPSPPPLEEPSPVVAESEPPPTTTPASPSIAVSDEILASCKLILGSIDQAPKFEFDKAELLPADLDVLRQIAECFTTGPMKDAGLQLIGRADPRGRVDYNDNLGMRRANSVAAQLSEFGIVTDRMQMISRGERDAVGTDEATWAIDRRVDIIQR